MNRHYLREDEDINQPEEGLTVEQTKRFTERGGVLLVYAAIILAIVLCVAAKAEAQTVPGKADVSWSAVTTGCTAGVTPCDNVALNAASAITGYEIYASAAPIPDNSTAAPVGTVTGSTATFAYTTAVTNGSTLYFRIKAVNAFGKSAAFSPQASKLIVLPVTPGVPTSVTITLTIG